MVAPGFNWLNQSWDTGKQASAKVGGSLEAGLAVSDRIRLAIAAPAEVQETLRSHAAWIAGEVLARECVIGDALPLNPAWPANAEVELDGATARIALSKDS